MDKKIAGMILIVLGSIPLIFRLLPLLGLGRGARTPGGGNFPAGGFPNGMPPSGITPPAAGPPGGSIIFDILRTLNQPYVLIIGVVLIVIGIILLTHKEKVVKN